MFISLWVLIPAAIALLIGVILTIRHIYRIETAMETWQRLAIDHQQAEHHLLKCVEEDNKRKFREGRKLFRAESALNGLNCLADRQENTVMQRAAAKALEYVETEPEDIYAPLLTWHEWYREE